MCELNGNNRIDKEVAITAIYDIMKRSGVTVRDLQGASQLIDVAQENEYKSTIEELKCTIEDYKKTQELLVQDGNALYEKLRDEMQESDSYVYNWCGQHLSATGMHLFNVKEPHKFKTAEVTFTYTVSVVVPDNFDEDQISELANDYVDYSEPDVEVSVEHSGLFYDEVHNGDYDNNKDNFDDDDFI